MSEKAEFRAHSEPIISKVKVKQDSSDADTIAKDIKTRLSLSNVELCDNRQTNGVHQINGTCESPIQSSETSSDELESTNVQTSHTNQSDVKEETAHTSKNRDIEYVSYTSELQMPDIMKLIQKDLSEPYSIYTYRYFIHNWPKLCFLATDGQECIGAIVCKLDLHRKVTKRGYIAMLAVDIKYRKRKIGSNLVRRAIQAMIEDDADEVVLETEITNHPALRLYENLGFVRDKRLFRYYLNGVDALRLKLWLR
ncbi:N-alpha-acetyltransferase 30-like [Phymastichus coffea]|uniref:N-alpha-acetyltransferase 30-like n=1 Tax=Phymastichus coffea TaxID=108790 RepID=UPI00273B4D12|nr:N-alpha-acetyltransferase 30-like [Phymastichus coffea]